MPRPKATATAFVGCASARRPLDLFRRLRQATDDTLTAFELMPRFGARHGAEARPGDGRPLAGEHQSYALIELSSPRPRGGPRRRFEAVLGAALEDGLVADATIAASEAQNQALWRLRETLSEVQGLEGGSIKHDVSVPVSRVADFIEAAEAACIAAMPGIRPCSFGHVGDGNIHYNLSQPVGMDKAAFLSRWETFNRIVHDIVAAWAARSRPSTASASSSATSSLHYKDPVALDMMRTLKRALDPQNILNPGKVIAIADDAPAALPVAKSA